MERTQGECKVLLPQSSGYDSSSSRMAARIHTETPRITNKTTTGWAAGVNEGVMEQRSLHSRREEQLKGSRSSADPVVTDGVCFTEWITLPVLNFSVESTCTE